MRAVLALTVANLKSYVRDRSALFWTLAFPLVFIVLFGLIFSGSRFEVAVAWVDEDGGPAATAVRSAFVGNETIELVELDRATALERMRGGGVRAVIVAPAGFSQAFEAAQAGLGPPANLLVFTDPSQSQTSGSVFQVLGNVLGTVNLGGRPPLVVPEARAIQTQTLSAISYFVPSVLAMSIMQLGVFAAIPLVADREKLILKRLFATPLARWQLVAGHVLMRLGIAVVQAIVIVGVGTLLFGVRTTGNWLAVGGFLVLGALAFLALGYVIASFAPTEDAANGMTSIVQFPLMFLSGIFFAIDQLPEGLQLIARFIPLTYLADALRQTMVDGTAFSPLWVCAAVLLGWLVGCFAVAARFFRWQ
ncbi:MAG TPA: ABC transporter permease [Candidatus Binatia bacterium]|nr:ABC transporter permease [Candidatus Binatia bacterium]